MYQLNQNTLVRLESSEVIVLPLDPTKDQLVYIDKIMDQIENLNFINQMIRTKFFFILKIKKRTLYAKLKLNKMNIFPTLSSFNMDR